MPVLVVIGVILAGLVGLVLLKAAFGLIGWIIGNLLWVAAGFTGGYYVAKRDKTRVH